MARVERLEAALAGDGAPPQPRRRSRAARAGAARRATAEPPRRRSRQRRRRTAAAPPIRRRPSRAARRPQAQPSRRAAAQPTPTAIALADEPDLDAIRTLWPAVLDAVRADNGLLAACLAEAHPVEVRGSEVVVAFAEHDTFNRQMADGREHRAAVDDALRGLAGSSLRVVFELRELERGSRAPSRPPRTSSWHASRRSSTPRRSSPTIRNPTSRRASPDAPAAEHAADAQAGPEDAAGHGGRAGAAQARGGRGVRGRRDGHGQGLRRPRRQVDHDRARGHRPRRSRAAAGHGPRRHQRGAARRPGAAAVAGSAGSPAAWTWARWACRASSACTPPPVQRLITELGKLPGIGQRTAQRLAFHILRSDAEDATALADAIREVKERIGLCEVCFNLADEPRCRICQDERRDAEPHLRRRGARRRHPHRAHARVPRALPRPRRGAVADRRHRPRGPEDRRALRARRDTGR